MRKISKSEYDSVKQLSQAKVISKTRYFLSPPNASMIVDEFDTPNKGCLLAELDIKLNDTTITPCSQSAQTNNLPAWLSDEVTDEPRYYNQHIVEFGFPNAWAAKLAQEERDKGMASNLEAYAKDKPHPLTHAEKAKNTPGLVDKKSTPPDSPDKDGGWKR